MKVAVGTDLKTHLVGFVLEELKKMGHEVSEHGALVQEYAPWPEVALEVAGKVAASEVDQAVLFCWTGTGISMAANKVRGVRAALCHDAETARGARLWNDANILAMSLRATSEQVAKEMLEAWFSSQPSEDEEDLACIRFLEKAERRLMK